MNNDLISREALKEEINKKRIVGRFNTIQIIDNAPTVEPCYQTTSCLDCGNYDKENHNCPRYCEVIKEAINSRPQGEWIFNTSFWSCSVCKNSVKTIGYCGDKKFMNEFFRFCPNCGADMRGKEHETDN